MEHHFNVYVAQKYGVIEAILIKNLYFWISKNCANNKNFYDGRYWTYNTAKAWAELFPYLTKRQVEYSLKKLIDFGLIVRGNYNQNPFDKTSWFSFTNKGILDLQKQYPEITKFVNGDSESVTSYNDTDKNLTDNNPDNTPVLASKESKTPPASKSGLFGYQEEEEDLTFSQAVEKQEDLTLQAQTRNSKFNYTPEFESFWSLYRTKQPKDKHPAFKAYLKAIKEISPDELLRILERHINYWTFENTKSSFIPYASTWLNKKRWLDELDGAFERGKAMGQYSDEIVDF